MLKYKLLLSAAFIVSVPLSAMESSKTVPTKFSLEPKRIQLYALQNVGMGCDEKQQNKISCIKLLDNDGSIPLGTLIKRKVLE